MIQIPETLTNVCRDNTLKALAMFDTTVEPSSLSLEEYQNFYQAKIFLEKFKMDGWILCRQIWDSVWGELSKTLKTDITYITGMYNCLDIDKELNDSFFTVSYTIDSKFDMNLSIVIDWQNKELKVCAAIENQDEIDSLIMKEQTDITESQTDNDGYSHNLSKHKISLIKNDTITDEDITSFKQFAQEIIDYFHKYRKDILAKL